MIEITDEMVRAAFQAGVKENPRGTFTVDLRIALAAVAPLIEAQVRERALRDVEGLTRYGLSIYGVDPEAHGKLVLRDDVIDVIFAIGAPPKEAEARQHQSCTSYGAGEIPVQNKELEP